MLESAIQIQKYFPKDRPKKGGRLVFTNVLIAYNEEIEDITSDVKYSLDRYKIRIGVQCIQYSEVVKIGYILFLIPKVDITEWIEFLLKPLKKMLEINIRFTLIVSKINDGTSFKDNIKRQGSTTVKARIGENIAVYVEIIKKQ